MEEEEDVETNRGSDNWGRLDNQEHSCCPDHLSETAILRREDLSDHHVRHCANAEIKGHEGRGWGMYKKYAF